MNLLSIEFLSGLFVFLFFWRRARNKTIVLKYQYKIFELRDKLRSKLIDGEINRNSWVYDFFDHSFSKASNCLEYITIYKAIYLSLFYRDNKKVFDLARNLEKNLKREPVLKEIYEDYGKIFSQFMVERHIPVIYSLISVLISFLASIKMCKKFISLIKTLILKLRIMPEISDYSYAH